MHELALAESIIEAVKIEAKKHGTTRVLSVAIKVGVLSDVVPDALQFGFEVLIKDTPLDGAVLKIELVSIKGNCKSCGRQFEVEEFLFVCPQCFGGDIEIIQGDELHITQIEIE